MAKKKEPYDIDSPEGRARIDNIANQAIRKDAPYEGVYPPPNYKQRINKAFPLKGFRTVPGDDRSAIRIPGLEPMDEVVVRAKRRPRRKYR